MADDTQTLPFDQNMYNKINYLTQQLLQWLVSSLPPHCRFFSSIRHPENWHVKEKLQGWPLYSFYKMYSNYSTSVFLLYLLYIWKRDIQPLSIPTGSALVEIDLHGSFALFNNVFFNLLTIWFFFLSFDTLGLYVSMQFYI